MRCLRPHFWNTLPGNIKLNKCSFEKFKKSINNWYIPSCNYNFVITKTKYLITFISTYLIQYPCIIYNTLICTPACYDCSNIINQIKNGGWDHSINPFTKWLKIFLCFLFLSTFHLPIVGLWHSVLRTVLQQFYAELFITWIVEVSSLSKVIV